MWAAPSTATRSTTCTPTRDAGSPPEGSGLRDYGRLSSVANAALKRRKGGPQLGRPFMQWPSGGALPQHALLHKPAFWVGVGEPIAGDGIGSEVVGVGVVELPNDRRYPPLARDLLGAVLVADVRVALPGPTVVTSVRQSRCPRSCSPACGPFRRLRQGESDGTGRKPKAHATYRATAEHAPARKEGRPLRDGLPELAYVARLCQLAKPYRASGWTRTAMAAIWARVAVSAGASVVSLVPLT